MVRRLALFLLLVIAAAATAHDALANPARIIILRHGEKGDAYRLCDVGVQRSLALAGRYLGRGAEASLFAGGEPDAFFVITLHTLELASPAVTTWRKPLIMYSVLPRRGQNTTRALNERTREATADVLSKWSGKTVVMVWEHYRIADAALEASFPDQKVTLRQLLNLDAVDAVPKTWPGETYDYFWIVDYDAGSARPARFELIKQTFAALYARLPSNDWGAANVLPRGCRN